MNDDAQIHVLEALLVAGLVFVAIAMTAIFRLPTNPSTFQQAELELLGRESLLALAAKPPTSNADCNESPCPFANELERMISIALGFEGPTPAGSPEARDVDPLDDFLSQSLPDGARYILYYSNGRNATTIHPLGLVPPRLDVAVGRALLSPNWTAYATQRAAAPVLRIGEMTGFTDATTDKIHDPLNRAQDEWGVAYKTHLSNAGGTKTVPVSVVYGTHKLCPAAGSCGHFTIVPPGVFGPGSPILPGDRDNSTSIQSLGAFYDLAKFRDNNPDNDALSPGEDLYLDLVDPGSNLVDVGDVRLSRVDNCVGTTPCYAGSHVASGDGDVARAIQAFPLLGRPGIRSLAGDADGVLEEGEHVYLDVDNDRTVSAGDRRFNRVATLRFGSQVASGDVDEARTLTAIAQDFLSHTVRYSDTDLDNAFDTGEPLYLDLDGNGQHAGLEALDIHISGKGQPTVRYVYDLKLVVWYGV